MLYKYIYVFQAILLFESTRCDRNVDNLITSLEELVTFCVKNENLIDVNLLFGIAIVAGQLPFIEISKMKYEMRRKLMKINDMCETIFEIAYNRNIANLRYDITQQIWLSPKSWSFDYPPTFLQNSALSLYQSIEENQDSSTFHQKYEICVRHLTKRRRITRNCLQLILNENSLGYTLTHQILYLQIVEQMINQNSNKNFFEQIALDAIPRVINFKCGRVYFEMKEIERQLNFNETLLDLFVEEVVVCGLRSYAEFFQQKYMEIILNTNSSNTNSFRINATKNKSNIHLISVQIAAIILYLKQLSKNQIND